MTLLTAVLDRQVSSKADPRLVWRQKARPEQLMPIGQWRVWYLQGGRGSGKTRSGAGALAEWVLGDTDGEGEYGIVGPTYADAWTKCVEGEAGILRALGTNMAEIKDHRSATVKSAWRTYGQVVMHNGIVIYVDSAAEGGLRIQGRNLKGAWCDEIGLWYRWELAWNESLRYAVRMGISRIIATGTPKASQPSRKLIRSLIRDEPEHGGVVRTRLRTEDNRGNLSEEFYRAVVGANRGTRLERQELEGELLDDVANALWERDLLERIQVPALGKPGGPADLNRVYIGVDPSDGAEDSDEQAYTVAGLYPMGDPRIYVVENWGGQESPPLFARRVINKAIEYNGTLVIEKNHGGAWLGSTFNQVMKDMGTRVPVRLVNASKSKRTRAEPVAAMYERNHGQTVFHAAPATDHFIDLEDQMATFTGSVKERSPDRLDSLVWALHLYLPMHFGPAVAKGGVKSWAAQADIGELAGGQTRAQQKLASAHGGLLTEPVTEPSFDGWDYDSFAPASDDNRHARLPSDHDAGPRPNVRTWR